MHFKVAVRNLDGSTDVMRVFSVFIFIYANTNKKQQKNINCHIPWKMGKGLGNKATKKQQKTV